jgi:secreted trypsin-like serine protease
LKEKFPFSPIFAGSGFCGASIISDEWVLTAAHCTYGGDINKMRLYAGCHDLYDGSCSQPYQIEQIFNHPTYKFPENDISLVRLSRPITFNERIYAACLPSLPFPTNSQPITIMGWGQPSDSEGLSQVLKTATMVTIPDEVCGGLYGGVTPDTLCALNFTGGTCRGDSGSFVGTVALDGKPEIHAVVSFGASLCEMGYPVGFQEVHRHLYWILNVVQEYSTTAGWTFSGPTAATEADGNSEEADVVEAKRRG